MVEAAKYLSAASSHNHSLSVCQEEMRVYRWYRKAVIKVIKIVIVIALLKVFGHVILVVLLFLWIFRKLCGR